VGKGEIGGADRGVILRQRLTPPMASVTDLHGGSEPEIPWLAMRLTRHSHGECCSNCSLSAPLVSWLQGRKETVSASFVVSESINVKKPPDRIRGAAINDCRFDAGGLGGDPVTPTRTSLVDQ
jgi:hypothetical protein